MTEGREELCTVLDFLRKGDVLMVTRIDRLARSIGDLQDRANDNVRLRRGAARVNRRAYRGNGHACPSPRAPRAKARAA
jgi:DNA invertase Pin-like site-specific DNA recombinase